MPREYNKEKIIKGFKRIIDERSLNSMTKSMYEFFYLQCDFIAHYNQLGFMDYYSGTRFIEFLEHFSNPSWYLFSNNPYQVWIQEMIQYVKENEKHIIFEFENKQLNKKIKLLRQLADELGYDIMSKNHQQVSPVFIEESGQISLF